MNAFLNNNGPPLTGVVDIAAHSRSLFQQNEEPQNIQNIFIPKSDISGAEPYDVQIDELGNNVLPCINSLEMLMIQKWLD